MHTYRIIFTCLMFFFVALGLMVWTTSCTSCICPAPSLNKKIKNEFGRKTHKIVVRMKQKHAYIAFWLVPHRMSSAACKEREKKTGGKCCTILIKVSCDAFIQMHNSLWHMLHIVWLFGIWMHRTRVHLCLLLFSLCLTCLHWINVWRIIELSHVSENDDEIWIQTLKIFPLYFIYIKKSVMLYMFVKP